MSTLAIYYKEPDPDRWLPGDRFPRRAIRRVVRGPRRPGGQERVFLNLVEGLKRLKVDFRVNDFGYARRNPSAPVGVIGKPHLLDRRWPNPIMFGASIMSHPLAAPDLLKQNDIKRILVPGEWMRDMCEPHWKDIVKSWPVGIDTEEWNDESQTSNTSDILLYNKIRWRHQEYEDSLVEPIREKLRSLGISFKEIKYGFYKEENFRELLKSCKAMIFLCEHETQGIAYQQALACGLPIFAWDRRGPWQDPEFYPEKVIYEPVSSVPYWDERCGKRFKDYVEFEEELSSFWETCKSNDYSPRDYILKNLTLEKCAQAYIDHWNETFGTSL